MAVTDKNQELSDERLVELSLDGDEGAFGLLVRRYQRRLTAFLSQLVGDIELARELSQEAFIRAFTTSWAIPPKALPSGSAGRPTLSCCVSAAKRSAADSALLIASAGAADVASA